MPSHLDKHTTPPSSGRPCGILPAYRFWSGTLCLGASIRSRWQPSPRSHRKNSRAASAHAGAVNARCWRDRNWNPGECLYISCYLLLMHKQSTCYIPRKEHGRVLPGSHSDVELFKVSGMASRNGNGLGGGTRVPIN